MSEKASPLFLERRSYRQRRLMDAARLLPVLAALLWLVPLLWPQSAGQVGTGGAAAVTTSSAILYIFGVWTLLAVIAFVLSLTIENKPDAPSDRSL
ncbi:MAG: hypothetical protein ACNA7O_15200 [Rhodobacterales bacterium]